jgi:hypothetical protein
MAAKKSDLLKCKTRTEVLDFAKRHRMPVRNTKQTKVQIGGWVCVFIGDSFKYIE